MDAQNKSSLTNKTVSGIFWSFSERMLAQVVSFVVSIVLARMLLPEEYGIIAIVTVLITICNVFVTSGFATSLIQKKDADDTDFSTVFYFGLAFAAVLYIGIYFLAPVIASIYEYESLTLVIRVMSVTILISSVKSVEHSFVTKAMQFRKFFWSTLGGTLASAVVGIVMAYMGFGVWALVAQYLTNNFIDTVVLWFASKWRPKLKFSFSRLKMLLSFGWKVLISNLLMTVYDELRTIIIGTVYTSEDLAYYQKGRQFPNIIVANINVAISSTLLPVMSKLQDDMAAIRSAIKRFLKIGSYLLMPIMVGLAVVAAPLVRLLLTEKWIECVPYLQLLCIGFAFMPLQTANFQAVLAVGRSDISLKAEFIKRGANILVLILTFKISVMAMVIGEVCCTAISFLVNTIVSKKLFNYGPLAQFIDIAPYILVSLGMGAAIWPISLLGLADIWTIVLQVIGGIIVYFVISAIFKLESYKYIINKISPILNKIGLGKKIK